MSTTWIAETEQRTGVRVSWHIVPRTPETAAACQIPFGAMVTPLKKDVPLVELELEPLRSKVGNVLNCFASVDVRNKCWTDNLTGIRTALPPHYAEWVSADQVLPETTSQVVEYVLPEQQTGYVEAPSFLLVVDTCIFPEEVAALKTQLQKLVGLMPSDATVGLITFGMNVMIHELGFQSCNKVIVIKGSENEGENVTAETLINHLGLRSGGDHSSDGLRPVNRFFSEVGSNGARLDDILEDLQVDEWPREADCRQKRATGMALHAAVSMMELLKSQRMARIMLFTGGVCTYGPGATAHLSMSKNIRQHQDITEGAAEASLVNSASKVYQALAERCIASGHPVDMFVASLDQTGYYEMRYLVERTGGYITLSDTFSSYTFSRSIEKVMERDEYGYLMHGYNARLSVSCSPDIKICGGIGAFATNNMKSIASAGKQESSQISDNVVGEGKTCVWCCGGIDTKSTYAIYFEVAPNKQAANSYRHQFLQFQLLYWHPSGRRRLRVITCGYTVEDPETNSLTSGFDQECSAALLARLAIHKCSMGEDSLDVLKWLDRKLIRLSARFGDYQVNSPETFQFPTQLGQFPQFMFHLRRSPFLQTFNASPDESAYYRSVLCRENVANTSIMIMPSLTVYKSTGEPPEPAPLDISSLRNNVTLLMDTFFHLVVWHGATVSQWLEEKYHEQPEYAHFLRSVTMPIEDAKRMLNERFPVPKYISCQAGGSQARFLLAKVNPSATHSNRTDGMMGGVDAGAGAVVLTDDVSIETFIEHLIKLAVSS